MSQKGDSAPVYDVSCRSLGVILRLGTKSSSGSNTQYEKIYGVLKIVIQLAAVENLKCRVAILIRVGKQLCNDPVMAKSRIPAFVQLDAVLRVQFSVRACRMHM